MPALCTFETELNLHLFKLKLVNMYTASSLSFNRISTGGGQKGIKSFVKIRRRVFHCRSLSLEALKGRKSCYKFVHTSQKWAFRMSISLKTGWGKPVYYSSNFFVKPCKTVISQTPLHFESALYKVSEKPAGFWKVLCFAISNFWCTVLLCKY